MLQQVLAQDGELDASAIRLLETSGIQSYRRLVQHPPWDAARAANLSVEELEAFDLFLQSSNHPLILRTGLPVLDAALAGGLRFGALHEVAGAAGIGKTQLAVTLAVRCACDYPGANVLYIDIERNFHPRRAEQIARARLRVQIDDARQLDERVHEVLSRIRVQRVESLAEFLHQMKSLEDLVTTANVQLIIVDSIAALRIKSQNVSFAQWEHHLLAITRQLKYVGDLHRVFLLTTNRATTVESEGGSFTRPSLGDTWAHCVTTRLVLERQHRSRVLTVVKCPSAENIIQPFEITESGVEPIEDDGFSARPIADDDFDIHDDVLRELDLSGLPTVSPSLTLRSTQQSTQQDGSENEDDHSTADTTEPAITRLVDSDDIVSDSASDSDS
ncbi:hypothetical protein PINS_up001450 [Pythium insidiosum]|nr:hypothetical protein PINS_up001450 [Pythium insidiosum]